ncbi:MAG: cupin domain-containing protein [Candidatus Eremiobacter antarcticus]
MAQTPEVAAKLCATGDALLKCKCKNPYRAILQAVVQGLDFDEIRQAYQRRHEGATLGNEDRQLLQAFDELVNDSAGQIDAIRAESDQRMRKVNVNDVAELTWSSPKGKFTGAGKGLSEALGRDPRSTDLNERHPFDVEILRIAPGKTPYPYHSHSAQWEFYHVLEGEGVVRHKDGTTRIAAGDAFLFQPETGSPDHKRRLCRPGHHGGGGQPRWRIVLLPGQQQDVSASPGAHIAERSGIAFVL